jgi:hypothetical protein
LRRVLFVFWLLIAIFASLPTAAGASAASISQTVTISGRVAEMRFVYIDDAGNLAKVVGNTTNNVTPTAISLNNHKLPMTDSIWQQYIALMDQHNWQLDAGITYSLNPVQISTRPNEQTISVVQSVILPDIVIAPQARPVFG